MTMEARCQGQSEQSARILYTPYKICQNKCCHFNVTWEAPLFSFFSNLILQSLASFFYIFLGRVFTQNILYCLTSIIYIGTFTTCFSYFLH